MQTGTSWTAQYVSGCGKGWRRWTDASLPGHLLSCALSLGTRLAGTVHLCGPVGHPLRKNCESNHLRLGNGFRSEPLRVQQLTRPDIAILVAPMPQGSGGRVSFSHLPQDHWLNHSDSPHSPCNRSFCCSFALTPSQLDFQAHEPSPPLHLLLFGILVECRA